MRKSLKNFVKQGFIRTDSNREIRSFTSNVLKITVFTYGTL